MCVTPRQTCPRHDGLGRNLRSKTRWFTGFCNSHQVSHFAAFFIDARAEISVAESRFDFDARPVPEVPTANGAPRGERRLECSLTLFAPGFVGPCDGRSRARRRSGSPTRGDPSIAPASSSRACRGTGSRVCLAGFDNDPSAGSPTETLLRLLLPLNDKVQWTSRDVAGSRPPTSPRSEHFTGPFNRINQVAFLFDVDIARTEVRGEEERRSHAARNARSGVIGGSASSYPLGVPHPRIRVDDKYLYSCDNKDNKVHGWVSSDQVPIGFWTITPSNEFRTGGPLKQDLTSHVAATMLSMFFSTHYAGEDLAPKFQSEEYWKKVFGPVYVYLNSDVRAKQNPSVLWDDAKHRMFKETASWPYNFPLSTDFLKSNQRGAVSGQLLVHDWFINKKPVAGASAYVGLAATGAAGSWQTESKGYQFWTQADSKGNFVINNVVPGTYSLFAWVPGTIGDYKYTSDITIKPGSNIKLRNVVFEPPRAGPTLWEIGIADRTAAEFFIPDTSPSIKIHSYAISGEKFREYGLWTRYKDLYPKNDLVYTIGRSDYRKDWFFAHVTRNVGNGVFKSTTWQIQFDLRNINKGANYTLHVALASATGAEMQVRFNNPNLAVPDFSTGQIGKDNAIARHGIHGLYSMYSIGIAGSRLIDGRNTIFLTQARTAGPFIGIMYDYLRFEGPALHVPASTINIGA
ncbi:probable rhamnogalacturonate lyase B [Olea europaea subsp. europaea]|uniref:rhamnogalacturonan endolyase n=1 Tax=Olea europaea subsp. europaea TaxID=158383 RepID=A0A8S0R6C3_OLEEU|nr:probable rhamnogalacturonate lyase B [Olea europaea subsp. europaea]